jgi:hypothetical protein
MLDITAIFARLIVAFVLCAAPLAAAQTIAEKTPRAAAAAAEIMASSTPQIAERRTARALGLSTGEPTHAPDRECFAVGAGESFAAANLNTYTATSAALFCTVRGPAGVEWFEGFAPAFNAGDLACYKGAHMTRFQSSVAQGSQLSADRISVHSPRAGAETVCVARCYADSCDRVVVLD